MHTFDISYKKPAGVPLNGAKQEQKASQRAVIVYIRTNYRHALPGMRRFARNCRVTSPGDPDCPCLSVRVRDPRQSGTRQDMCVQLGTSRYEVPVNLILVGCCTTAGSILEFRAQLNTK